MKKRAKLEQAGYKYYDAVFTNDRFIVPSQGVNEHIQNWHEFEEMGFIRVKGGIMAPPKRTGLALASLGMGVIGVYALGKLFK